MTSIEEEDTLVIPAQCSYLFTTGGRKGQSCERPVSVLDIQNKCFCCYHYIPHNRAKRFRNRKPPSIVVEEDDEMTKRFAQRYEEERIKMKEDQLYKKYRQKRLAEL